MQDIINDILAWLEGVWDALAGFLEDLDLVGLWNGWFPEC